MMKRCFCVLILSFIVLSCHNEPTSVDSSQAITLFGKWQWIASSGGLVGQIVTPLPNIRVIQTYTYDGIFSQSWNDTVQISSHFIIKRQKTIYSIDSLNVIVYQDSRLAKEVVVYLAADTLVLGDNFYDGFSSVYKRIYQ